MQNKLLLEEFSHKSCSRNINSHKGNSIPALQMKIDNIFVYNINFFVCASFDQFEFIFENILVSLLLYILHEIRISSRDTRANSICL